MYEYSIHEPASFFSFFFFFSILAFDKDLNLFLALFFTAVSSSLVSGETKFIGTCMHVNLSTLHCSSSQIIFTCLTFFSYTFLFFLLIDSNIAPLNSLLNCLISCNLFKINKIYDFDYISLYNTLTCHPVSLNFPFPFSFPNWIRIKQFRAPSAAIEPLFSLN